MFRMHGGVFHQRDRFAVAGNIGQQAQSGFAQRPHFVDVRAGHQWKMIPQAGLSHLFFDLIPQVGNLLGRCTCKFNNQNGARIALDKEPIFSLGDVLFGALHDHPVDQFHGAGLKGQGDQISLNGLFQGIKMGADEPLLFWRQRDQVKFDFRGKNQRPL